MITDLKVTQSEDSTWDFSLSPDGDLATVDSLDTSITYAILGEKRASESEVAISQNRRGWIGNEGKSFENGSKIWLFEQSRLTRTILNEINDAALSALNYLIEENAAERITSDVSLLNGVVVLELNNFINPSIVETRFFQLWSNTGSN